MRNVAGLRKRWLMNTLSILFALGLVCALAVTAVFALYHYSGLESDMRFRAKTTTSLFSDYISIFCLCQGSMHRDGLKFLQLSMNFAYCISEQIMLLYPKYICPHYTDRIWLTRRILPWLEFLIFPQAPPFCRKMF